MQQKAKTKPNSPFKPLLFLKQILKGQNQHQSLLLQTSNPQPYVSKKYISTSAWEAYAPVRAQNHYTAVNTSHIQQKSAAVRTTELVTAFIVWVEKKQDSSTAHSTSSILP